jgi:hypothetical protein
LLNEGAPDYWLDAGDARRGSWALVEQAEKLAHNVVDAPLVAQQIAAALYLRLAFGLEEPQRLLQLLIDHQAAAIDCTAAQELPDFLRNDCVVVGQVVVQVDQAVRCDGRHRHRSQCLPGSVQFLAIHNLFQCV